MNADETSAPLTKPAAERTGTAAGGAPIVPHRWRKLASVSAAFWSDNNETSVLSSLSPVIIAALALPVSAVGVLVSVSKAIGIVFGPVWNWVAHRTSRKGTLVITTALVSACTAATGLAQNYGQLILAWSVAAVFIAAGLPIVTEIIADLFDERSRGRANGYTWGMIALLSSVLGPLLGQLARVPDGWRIGFFASGAIGVLITIGIIVGFQDPGLGASEPALRNRTAAQRAAASKLTWAKIGQLARIPTFVLMLGQRLLAGQLLIATFGVLFLVQERGLTTEVATLVMLPFGAGFLIGTFGGGVVTDLLNARFPQRGHVVVLQTAQFGIGTAALLGMQIDWGSIAIFAIFWTTMGFMQGINPSVNRPIVAAVVPPELRGAAFALMLSVFEAIAFIALNLSAGFLAATLGLSTVMLLFPGILMIVNGLYCTALYRTYPRDVARLEAQLRLRAAEQG